MWPCWAGLGWAGCGCRPPLLAELQGAGWNNNSPFSFGFLAQVLREELEAYNAAAAAGQDSFGKTAFPTTIDLAQPLYVARITPVIHYTMVGCVCGVGVGG